MISYISYFLGSKPLRIAEPELVEAEGSAVVGIIIASVMGVLCLLVCISDVPILYRQCTKGH